MFHPSKDEIYVNLTVPFLANLRYQSFFGVHFLQSAVLVFEFLQALHERSVHTTEFSSPFVERGFAHGVLSAQIGDLGASLILFQDRQDLAVRIS